MRPGEALAGCAIFVTIGTHGRQSVFRSRWLAQGVFDTLVEHELTVAAVVMPDHVHWLLEQGKDVVSVVGRFKTESTRFAWALGYGGRLWQRSFFDTMVRSERLLAVARRYVIENPLRRGLVDDVADYPWVHPHPK